MKSFTKTQRHLLQLLADGHCHSGISLGEQLGVSRTAIWKQIKQLTLIGLPIKRISQQGYQLTHPMILLDEALIRHHLASKAFTKEAHFHLFATIGSTNQFLKELALDPAITICCAETQTQGRGRFGRRWVSPFGENIYFSSRWMLSCCLSSLSGLSLIVGLAIIASLADSQIHDDIRIKWPNDILWGQKKLAGILIEVIAETNGCAQVIIGIGLNVNTATETSPLEDKPWCSLYEITKQHFDRNVLLAHLIHHLDQCLDRFLTLGFAGFSDKWQTVDYLYGKLINVNQPNCTLTGYACGVNELGQLCLRDTQGKLHYLSTGDTSLREF